MTGFIPNPKTNKWYYSVGQGMGGALNVAVNKEAYILSDRSTWESFKIKKITKLLLKMSLYYSIIMGLSQ